MLFSLLLIKILIKSPKSQLSILRKSGKFESKLHKYLCTIIFPFPLDIHWFTTRHYPLPPKSLQWPTWPTLPYTPFSITQVIHSAPIIIHVVLSIGSFDRYEYLELVLNTPHTKWPYKSSINELFGHDMSYEDTLTSIGELHGEL